MYWAGRVLSGRGSSVVSSATRRRFVQWKGSVPALASHNEPAQLLTTRSARSHSARSHSARSHSARSHRAILSLQGQVRTHATQTLTKPEVTLTSTSAGHDSLKVTWGDGEADVYPYVWLRDNCQCPQCFLATGGSRVYSMLELSFNVSPAQAQVTEGGGVLEVVWDDGHVSTYNADWLKARAFNQHARSKHQLWYRLPRKCWGADFSHTFPRAVMDQVMSDDQKLLEFLVDLETWGLVVVQGARQEEGELHRFSTRVSHLRPTNYGETFTVKSKADPSNAAYTGKHLDMHCDLVFLDPKPDVQLLHCITQFEGEGGANTLADSVAVAEQLRRSHPHHFATLATTPVYYRDHAVDQGFAFDIIRHAPMITLDRRGEVETVNISTTGRDSHLDLSPSSAVTWYEAFLTYRDLLHQPDNYFSHKLDSGDILVVDNTRVLHGRTGYEAAQGSRHFHGGYWDWDMIRSTRRVLASRLSTTA